MRNTQMRKWNRIARTETFSLFQNLSDPLIFEASWKVSAGSYKRRRFRAGSIDLAKAKAPQVVQDQPANDREEGPYSLALAFAEALRQTKRGVGARRDWLRDQERFMRWLLRHHSDCRLWSQLRRSMVRSYIESLNGLSPNSVRIALQPITQTAGYMSREYQVPNVAERLGIGSALVRTPAHVYLSDVVRFLGWLHEREPRLEVGAALQGFAGLQLQEALRLTWDKVDLDRGLIEVSGEVKNPYRKRVIPVCSRLLISLQQESRRAVGKIRSDWGPVVRSPEGFSYAENRDSWKNYSHAMGKLIRAWNPEIGWAPKDLRNCLPTFAMAEGLQSDVWEQYIGHVPRSVTAKHYVPRLGSKSLGEADALVRQMRIFRTQVIEPVERAIEGGEGAKILIVPTAVQNHQLHSLSV